MHSTIRNANSALARHVPPIRIFLKSHSDTRYFELSPLKQVMLGSVAAVGIGWTLVATAALLLSSFQSDSALNQAQVLQQAYEARIAALTAERDQSLLGQADAQNRFSLALQQVSGQQSQMLDILGDQTSMQAELDLMRQKYDQAIIARDQSQAQMLTLAALQDQAAAANVGSTATELTGTLQTISLALSETVRERDLAAQQLLDYQGQIAGLELKMRVAEQRQDRMISKLEEAVSGSFLPLQDMFEDVGLDVASLVGDVRLSHSGTGGPLTPVLSSKGADPADVATEVPVDAGDRFQNLISDIDALNALRIAAEGLPFADPVDGSYRITSGFGGRNDPINGGRRKHEGTDMAGRSGQDILATGDGTVVFAGRQSGYGNMIKIRHTNGFETVYGHLSKIGVSVGDQVSRGDHIGDMGNTGRSTGTHLHYEIRVSGTPVNPMKYLEAARNVF